MIDAGIDCRTPNCGRRIPGESRGIQAVSSARKIVRERKRRQERSHGGIKRPALRVVGGVFDVVGSNAAKRSGCGAKRNLQRSRAGIHQQR